MARRALSGKQLDALQEAFEQMGLADDETRLLARGSYELGIATDSDAWDIAPAERLGYRLSATTQKALEHLRHTDDPMREGLDPHGVDDLLRLAERGVLVFMKPA